MPITRTVSEFSSSRKIRYGDTKSNEEKAVINNVNAKPLTCDAGMSPHKSYYAQDNAGESYIIEFNVGDFRFDEISISTEGQRLSVKGKNKYGQNPNELSQEFSRSFTLPDDVNPNSIKAHLEEHTRLLRLTGRVQAKPALNKQTTNNSYSSAYDYNENLVSTSAKLGSIKENRSSSSLDYEIYLGNDLKDGQIIFEVPNSVTLNVKVIKNDYDKYGSINLELRREIKLPPGAKLQNIDHRIDNRTGNLIIKVPYN